MYFEIIKNNSHVSYVCLAGIHGISSCFLLIHLLLSALPQISIVGYAVNEHCRLEFEVFYCRHHRLARALWFVKEQRESTSQSTSLSSLVVVSYHES